MTDKAKKSHDMREDRHGISLNQDTICALATPTGGALATIRLSGNNAISIVDDVFSRNLANVNGGTLHYGEISTDDNESIDDVVVAVWRSPHSYTGEDCVEISCHGSAYIVGKLLALLEAHGARQAKAGEYTQRAFLNGKMDLSQAEAVADLIASTNRAQHQLAISQLKGHFSDELAQLRDRLLRLASLLELELDFSDHEDLEFADRAELRQLTCNIDTRIMNLADSFKTGNALKNGIPVTIVGKTNVGKSTLLNALLHEERAIVSDMHGTTRDLIEDTTVLHGVTFRFIDTAGLRHTDDIVEQIGIRRALSAIHRATIVLWVIDETPTPDETKRMQELTRDKHLIIVVNKSDIRNIALPFITDNELPPHPGATAKTSPTTSEKAQKYSASLSPATAKSPKFKVQAISAKNGNGIPELEQAIYTCLNLPEISSADVVVTNARHHTALMEAHTNLTRVLDGMDEQLPSDLLAEDLKAVLDDLASITGQQRIVPQETLNFIFSHFCVGK